MANIYKGEDTIFWQRRFASRNQWIHFQSAEELNSLPAYLLYYQYNCSRDLINTLSFMAFP